MVNFDPTQVQTNIQKYVDTLLVYDQNKVTDLQNRVSTLQQKSSAISQVVSSLSALSSYSDISFNALKVTSSNTSVATASASGKIGGSVSVNVERLAGYQVLDWSKLSSALSDVFHYDASATVSSNDFWKSLVGTTFTVSLQMGDGSTENVDVDLSKYNQDSTLAQVMDDFALQVNAHSSKIRVYKQKLNDGTFALQSSSLSTGKNSAISKITIGSNDFTNTNSLDELDAKFSVNGYDYVRSSNTFSDIIPNLTVTLQGTGSSTITVSGDTSAISQGLSNFAQVFKSFSDKVRSLINADPSNQGVLSSDASTLRQIMDSIRTKLMNPRSVTVDGVSYNFNASQIGFSFDEYGTISFDTSKLNSYISGNVKGLDILSSWWGSVNSDIKGYINTALGSNGTLGRLQSNYTTGIKSINDQISQLNDQMETKKAALVEQVGNIFNSMYQYQSMFAQMNSLFGVSSS
ncbi:flagellar filament capping protein FliD [Coprothermobacter platensis]|jgi:flagellar hook-associated protein 2|uniref:flagellar filament capping protein FliD n=1 Tax=Coprothermobacter platensis TaxID=108819 RepID=UPI0003788500|nr:flagellar filament capping protein FliD [Coprothermobacter platensis]